jgi:DNA-binding transcriptional regulator YbjK
MGVARPRRQEGRREQLVQATARAIAARGLVGLRLKHIADEAGLSIGSVLYYYPDLDALLTEVHADVLEQFYWDRVRATDAVAGAPQRLVEAVSRGVRSDRTDVTVRVIYELHAAAARSPVHAELMTTLWEREVSLFEGILEQGAAAGDFHLVDDARSVAETAVALEDAFDLHLTSDNSAVDRGVALARILSYLSLATGCTLTTPREHPAPPEHPTPREHPTSAGAGPGPGRRKPSRPGTAPARRG